MDPLRIRSDLLAWYDVHGRDLPWRDRTGRPDPYPVWVSEVMLQQTRVETVRPYFARWMEAFPTVEALAVADEEAVLGHWSGLGYYSRVRNLHAAARVVVARGGFPRTAEELRSLPGVGVYTSGAVASIAFGEAVPAVDGNVLRVTARLTAETGDPRTPAVRRRLDSVAAGLVDHERPGDWNQAVMDLGATVCTLVPDCARCPLVRHCAAHRLGIQATIPPSKKQRPVPVEDLHLAVVEDRGRVLLVRRPATGLLARTWMLPGGPATTPLEDHVRRQTGLLVRPADAAGTVEHRFTHRLWRMTIHAAHVLDGSLRGDARWADADDLERLGLSTAARKALATKPM